jgi:hypothetical protein
MIAIQAHPMTAKVRRVSTAVQERLTARGLLAGVVGALVAFVVALLVSRLGAAPTAPAKVLPLDDCRERLAIPARTQAIDRETPAPQTHGRYQW